MNDSKIHISTREINIKGRMGICVKADEYAPIGSMGVIDGICISLDGKQLTAELEWEVVEPSDKDPRRKMMVLPKPVTVWVDYKKEDDAELWEEMVDHGCFKDMPVEDQMKRVSYDFEPVTASGVLITKVNERFPEFQRGLAQCRTNKQRETYREYVKQQLNHSALFDITNIHFPAPVEGDEFYDSEDCSDFIDHTKYRCYSNDFINICYRATQARIAHCAKKQDDE